MNGKLLILFVIIVVALGLATFLGGNMIENMENPTPSTDGTTPPTDNSAPPTNQTSTPSTTDNVIPATPSMPLPTSTPAVVPGNQSESPWSQFFSSFTINTPSFTIPSFTISTAPTNTNSPMNPLPQQNIQNSSNMQNVKTTGDFDNYNHYNKTSYPDQFYGTNGGTARVIDTGSNNMLIITHQNGATEMYYLTGEKQNSNAYYGPNGSTASLQLDNGNVVGVKVSRPNSSDVFYFKDKSKITQNIDETLNKLNANAGSSKGTTLKEAFSLPLQDEASKWKAALPKGIPKSQILPGDEDLYILKSEVIPPVCPKCPEPIVNCPGESKFDTAKCPPCPPCARCPEPAFECKKVPNYNAFNPNYMPVPVLSDFSAFGM
jgi:hypothetical protein